MPKSPVKKYGIWILLVWLQEEQPHVQGVVAVWGRAERSYSTFKVRRGGGEEIPLVQGKEQWLCFAGAAVKR